MHRRSLVVFYLLVAVVVTAVRPVEAKPGFQERLVLMWQVHHSVSDEELALLKRKGVNLVQSFSLINWSDDLIRSYLDRMDRNGFGVVMSIVGMSEKLAGEWTVKEESLSSFVRKWRGHPAVFAWHTFDEPSNRKVGEVPKEFQEQVYGQVKYLDPDHPIMVSWNGTSWLHYRYFTEKAFDLVDLHAYVTDNVGSRQAALVETFRKHKTRIYPVIITIALLHRPQRPPLPSDTALQQYRFFFKENALTKNIGFYGWDLSKNIGIRKDGGLKTQFLNLDIGK